LQLVCHNWPVEECVRFLKNCHKALPKHGKMFVLDYIIPEVRELDFPNFTWLAVAVMSQPCQE